jgi:hypothetical protein
VVNFTLDEISHHKLKLNSSVMARLMNKTSVIAIMNKRGRLDESFVGKKVQLTIQGNGTTVDVKTKEGVLVESVVEPGTVFQKKIFNVQANSAIAMKNVENNKLAAAGLAAERAGNYEEAHKHYTAFLNAMQVSFSVPSTSPILHQLGDRVDIEARVIKITTPNGSLLTIDPATIRVLEPETLSATTFSFDLEDETPPVVVTDDAKTLLEGKEAGPVVVVTEEAKEVALEA